MIMILFYLSACSCVGCHVASYEELLVCKGNRAFLEAVYPNGVISERENYRVCC